MAAAHRDNFQKFGVYEMSILYILVVQENQQTEKEKKKKNQPLEWYKGLNSGLEK